MSGKSTSKGFATTPTLGRLETTRVQVATDAPASATALGVPVASDFDVPASIGLTRERLAAAGFDAAIGDALVVPTPEGPTVIAFGVGRASDLDATAVRDAAAAFARAASSHVDLAIVIPQELAKRASELAQAIVEGALLARYRYDPLRNTAGGKPIEALTLVTDADGASAGAARGRTFASVTEFARDFANSPHSHLTASGLAEIAVELGSTRGFDVELFDKDDLIELGCGGLLGVNQGSTEPPRMIKMTYAPSDPVGHLAFVGKGIMYDSGGLALKPGDEVHAQMKNDMSGAAAVLAAMSALAATDCSAKVTAYLMCTDNMPSGTAIALGDVLTMRGGTTVEVINTDAEGRLVMADALVLATEEGVDAIIDIATLTGACMRALGTSVAGVMGNDDALIAQIRAAASVTDESVWPLPLEPRYRKQLDSTVADLRNLGGANAGAITAALFLAEFVGDVPWAHIDMAGTAQSEGESGWQTAGCTGFGARLVLQTALDFQVPV